MPEEFGSVGGLRPAERSFAGWRIIAAAWAVVIVALMLFAGVQALASRPVVPVPYDYSGVVIPRHDLSCAAPNAETAQNSSCQGDIDSEIERAETSYYGW